MSVVPTGPQGIIGDIWGGVKSVVGTLAGGACDFLPPGANTVCRALVAQGANEDEAAAQAQQQQLPMGPMLPGGVSCPRGYRANKSNYFLKDGTYVPRGTRCVRYRRRNNLNQRALTRAVSRIEGYTRTEKRVEKALRRAAPRRRTVRRAPAKPCGCK